MHQKKLQQIIGKLLRRILILANFVAFGIYYYFINLMTKIHFVIFALFIAVSSQAQVSKSGENYLFVNDRVQVSHLYPNPAVDYAEIDFQINSGVQDVKLTFYNILGQEIKEITLERDQRSMRIPMRDFNSGMYMYQLSIDGRSVATKKLIVRKGM